MPGFARTTDPPTSHAAARTVNVTALENDILNFLRRHPERDWTVLEITRNIYPTRLLRVWNISPRMKHLVADRLIIHTRDRDALNVSGNMTSQRAYRIARAVRDNELTWRVGRRQHSDNEREEKLLEDLRKVDKRRNSIMRKLDKLHAKMRALTDRRNDR